MASDDITIHERELERIWKEVVMANSSILPAFDWKDWRRRSKTSICRAMAQVVSRRLRARVRSCGICGRQSSTGIGFLRVLRFPLPICTPPTAPHSSSSIIRGWYNRPNMGRRTKWTHSQPMRKIKKNKTSIMIAGVLAEIRNELPRIQVQRVTAIQTCPVHESTIIRIFRKNRPHVPRIFLSLCNFFHSFSSFLLSLV
jgi:hypothetical protein